MVLELGPALVRQLVLELVRVPVLAQASELVEALDRAVVLVPEPRLEAVALRCRADRDT